MIVTQKLLQEKVVHATKEEEILHVSTVANKIIPVLDVGEGQMLSDIEKFCKEKGDQ